MIEYQRDQQQTIPVSEVKIIGLGGAGANMIDRVALNGGDASTMLALNTDSRTLTKSLAGEKVQLGQSLTRGLGAGGDPELGLRATQEAETEIRDALRNQKIVFICVGLGGGTGSGSAPLVTRIAREQGAFVVVFATMPFEFEGRRRREQAETSLNELSVLSNALVTFDNGRMGELVLASKGIHEAFAAADVMIAESIKAVTRLVIQPGLINVGLDDLVSALKSNRSRCLFGSGIAEGENRSQKALKNALNSPLLDKGSLLRSSTTVLVHICGGSSMTLYEVQLLMHELSKNVPEDAHVLFGAAVDDSMGDSLSITLISALPEELLCRSDNEKAAAKPVMKTEKPVQPATPELAAVVAAPVEAAVMGEATVASIEVTKSETQEEVVVADSVEELLANEAQEKAIAAAKESESALEVVKDEEPEVVEEKGEADEDIVSEDASEDMPEEVATEEVVTGSEDDEAVSDEEDSLFAPKEDDEITRLEVGDEDGELELVGAESSKSQGEFDLDGGPKGKFSGEAPNVVDGEDLDIPPFLRNR